MLKRSAVLLALLCVARSASAEDAPVAHAAPVECPVMAGADPALGKIDAAERLAFIQQGLRNARLQARVWHYTWTGINLAIGAGQAIAIPFLDDEQRIDRYIGLGATVVGVATLWMQPMRAMFDSVTLDKKVAAAKPGDDSCRLLAEAEEFLRRDAKNEARIYSWWPHALTIGFGAALGSFIAFGFGHYVSGGVTAVTSMSLGELRLQTQPTYSIKLLRQYRDASLRLPETKKFLWWVSPLVTPDPTNRFAYYGASLGMIF